MKKISIRIAIVLLISFIAVLFIFTPSQAQDDTVTETETFDNTQLEGWEHSPEVVVTDGVLQIYSGQFAMKYGDWGDFDMSIQVKFSGAGEIVIGYHFRDEGRYTLHILTDEVTLVKEVSEPFTEIGSVNYSGYVIGEWLDIRIVLTGGDHSIYLNNELLLTISETDVLTPGPFLLHVTGENIGEFDNLTITGKKTSGIPEGEPGQIEGEPEPGQEPPTGGELGDMLWTPKTGHRA